MKISDLTSYIENLYHDGLTKIEIKAGSDEEMSEDFFISETKETFVYGEEDDADDKINEVRQLNGFKSAEKKFKAGKMNKAGEIVKPDTWTVVVKLLH